MPQFAYRAKKGPQENVEGLIEASSSEDAVEKLDKLGLVPIRVEEAKEGVDPAIPQVLAPSTAARPSQPTPAGLLKGKIKSQEITTFGRQLASLTRSGVPILKALWIISEQSENGRFKEFLSQAYSEIKDGKHLSEVLSRHPKLFPPIYIAMVRAGEDSGTLQETLLRVSQYRQRQEEILSKVRSAMAYPILMGITGVGTIIFMLSFVIPRLTRLFSTMGSSLPLPTRILMTVSGVFQEKLFWAVFFVVLTAAIFLLKFRAAAMKVFWSHLALRLPLIKNFVLMTELARVSRTLELLIKSGTPILKTIEIATPVFTNSVLREEFAKSRAEIEGGGSLGKGLKERKVFPLFMTNLILVGEESGRMDEALDEVACFYERETDEVIKTMTSLVEPLMVLGMGLVVGFIVIAMLLPMFELSMAVK